MVREAGDPEPNRKVFKRDKKNRWVLAHNPAQPEGVDFRKQAGTNPEAEVAKKTVNIIFIKVEEPVDLKTETERRAVENLGQNESPPRVVAEERITTQIVTEKEITLT